MLRVTFIQMLGALPFLRFLQPIVADVKPIPSAVITPIAEIATPLSILLGKLSVSRTSFEEECEWFSKFEYTEGKKEVEEIAKNPTECFQLITEHLEKVFSQAASFYTNISEFNKRLNDDEVCQKLYDIELRRQFGLLRVIARAWCKIKGSTSHSDFSILCKAVADGNLHNEIKEDGKPSIRKMMKLRGQLECWLECSHIEMDSEDIEEFVSIKKKTSAERKAMGDEYYWHRHIFRNPTDDFDEKMEYLSSDLQQWAELIPGMRNHILQEVARLYVEYNLTEADFPILQDDGWQSPILPRLSSFLKQAVTIKDFYKSGELALPSLPSTEKHSALPERSERTVSGVDFAFNPEVSWAERVKVVDGSRLNK